MKNALPLYSNRGQIGYVNPALHLINELWDESSADERCPYVRKDSHGCYCVKCSVSPTITDEGVKRNLQGLPCDTASLQLFCLDQSRYHHCVIFEERT